MSELQCVECGDAVIGSRFNLEEEREHYRDTHCYTDMFWSEHHRLDNENAGRRGRGEAVVVDGAHYIVNPVVENPRVPRALGMGGRLMRFRLQDGRVLESNDVWFQGDIPERWRDRLPDNAEFYRAPRVEEPDDFELAV